MDLARFVSSQGSFLTVGVGQSNDGWGISDLLCISYKFIKAKEGEEWRAYFDSPLPLPTMTVKLTRMHVYFPRISSHVRSYVLHAGLGAVSQFMGR